MIVLFKTLLLAPSKQKLADYVLPNQRLNFYKFGCHLARKLNSEETFNNRL